MRENLIFVPITRNAAAALRAHANASNAEQMAGHHWTSFVAFMLS